MWRAASICSWILCGVRAALAAFIPQTDSCPERKTFRLLCLGLLWVSVGAGVLQGPPPPDVPAVRGAEPWVGTWQWPSDISRGWAGNLSWQGPGEPQPWGQRALEPGRGCTPSWGVESLAVSLAMLPWHKLMGKGLWKLLWDIHQRLVRDFRESLEQHSLFRSCIHSPCPAHGALQVCWDVAGDVWSLQAGGNGRNSKEGCTDLPMAPQGWKSPWNLAVPVPAMGTGAGPALPALPHTFWA